MRRSIYILTVTLFLSACQTVHSATGIQPDSHAVPQTVAVQADDLFDAVAAQYPALNVTVRKRGRIVWEREGGTLRDSRDGVNRKYNFYSTAKMLTGLAYARLAQEGLDLGQSVRKIDPNLPTTYEEVTLSQLLSHTGGVRHYKDGGEDWKAFNALRCAVPAEALAHFINDPLSFRPGERLQYSSYGFVLLSHLLTKVTRTPTFDAAMRKVLGDAFTEAKDRADADKAVPYIQDEGSFVALKNHSSECKFGAGGLIASSRDLALTGEALYEGRIVDSGQIANIFQPTAPNNPFSHGAVIRTVDGIHVIGHSGGSPGGRGYLEVWVEPRVAVGITGNLEGPSLGDLAGKLGKIFAAY